MIDRAWLAIGILRRQIQHIRLAFECGSCPLNIQRWRLKRRRRADGL
jgi:hypothetical protein